jgi:hypothetical protein
MCKKDELCLCLFWHRRSDPNRGLIFTPFA